MTEYTQRLHAFVPERTYTVGPQALTWQDAKGGSGELAHADLDQVCLSFAPTRVQLNRYALSLRGRRGSIDKITNEHYRGLADFEDRSAAYRTFVIDLHRAVATANPAVRFTAGTPGARRLLHWVLCLFIAAVLVGALFFFIAIGFLWLALIKLLIIAYYLPTLVRYMRRNRPATYDPLAIPENVLPTLAAT